jgi:hypothetical protein
VGGWRSAVFLGALALGLSSTADGSRVLTRAPFRWLLIMPTELHLAVDAFAMQLLFEGVLISTES